MLKPTKTKTETKRYNSQKFNKNFIRKFSALGRSISWSSRTVQFSSEFFADILQNGTNSTWKMYSEKQYNKQCNTPGCTHSKRKSVASCTDADWKWYSDYDDGSLIRSRGLAVMNWWTAGWHSVCFISDTSRSIDRNTRPHDITSWLRYHHRNAPGHTHLH